MAEPRKTKSSAPLNPEAAKAQRDGLPLLQPLTDQEPDRPKQPRKPTDRPEPTGRTQEALDTPGPAFCRQGPGADSKLHSKFVLGPFLRNGV